MQLGCTEHIVTRPPATDNRQPAEWAQVTIDMFAAGNGNSRGIRVFSRSRNKKVAAIGDFPRQSGATGNRSVRRGPCVGLAPHPSPTGRSSVCWSSVSWLSQLRPVPNRPTSDNATLGRAAISQHSNRFSNNSSASSNSRAKSPTCSRAPSPLAPTTSLTSSSCTRKKTRVTVVGETSVEALQPGVLVQFDSLLNSRRTLAKAPIESLTILTPSARTRPGVISDTPKDLSNPFTVRGTIKRIIGPQITLDVARKQVRADLAEEASVEVEVSDFSLVSNGDKIEVKGAEVNPGLVHATDVKILLSKPLGETDSGDETAEGQPAPRSRSRQRAAAKKR